MSMASDRYRPQVLPNWVRSLAPGIPRVQRGVEPLDPMPPGTLYALTEHAGWAVPPNSIKLEFGRSEGDVHLPIGTDDLRISRFHGYFHCAGGEWWIRNEGAPITIMSPDTPMLLTGRERALQPGYTPLLLGDPRARVHFLEVRISTSDKDDPIAGPDAVTLPPQQFDLSELERLVLTSLAQNFLLGLPRPQPAPWKQVAAELSELTDKEWIPHGPANIVARIRERFSDERCKPYPIPGLMSEDKREPVGDILKLNLIRAMIQSATLTTADLKLLGIEPD
jgi:hypothetical protein